MDALKAAEETELEPFVKDLIKVSREELHQVASDMGITFPKARNGHLQPAKVYGMAILKKVHKELVEEFEPEEVAEPGEE